MENTKEKRQSFFKKQKHNDFKNISFVDWIEKFIEKKQTSISKVTFVGYKRVEKSLRGYFGNNLKLNELTDEHLRQYFKHLKEERNNKNNTIKHQTRLIYPALKQAQISGLIKQNPADFLEPIKIEKTIPSFYTKNDLKILFQKIKGHKAELAIKVAAYYGFRRSELIGLKWKSVDFFNKTIKIENKLLVLNKEIISTSVLKTASSNRVLPLLPEIEKDLQLHKKQIESQKKLLGAAYNTQFLEYVFITENGNLLRPSYVSQSLRNIIKQHKLKKIRFHDLRHSCASLLLSNGVAMKDIQEWLGHSNFKTTADVYSHLTFSSKIEAGKKLSKSLNFAKSNTKDIEKLKNEIKQLKKQLKEKQKDLKALEAETILENTQNTTTEQQNISTQ